MQLQVEAPELDVLPVGQVEQTGTVPLEYVPAAQLEQDPPLRACPGEQLVMTQVELSELGDVPEPQVVHEEELEGATEPPAQLAQAVVPSL